LDPPLGIDQYRIYSILESRIIVDEQENCIPPSPLCQAKSIFRPYNDVQPNKKMNSSAWAHPEVQHRYEIVD
jgi:hypothetical protein